MKKYIIVGIAVLSIIATGCQTKPAEKISKEIEIPENFVFSGKTDEYSTIIDIYFNNIMPYSLEGLTEIERDKSLKNAYDLKHETTITFDEFKKNYENAIAYKILKKENLNNKKFKVIISIFYKNHTSSLHESIFEYIDGKIKTVSTKRVETPYLLEEYIISEDTKAQIVWDTKDQKVVLIKGGQTNVIESRDHIYESPYFQAQISNLKHFKYNFISYQIAGWEYLGTTIVDIDQNKKMDEFEFPEILDITEDRKYFVACSPSGMAGNYVKVYTLPDFTLTPKSGEINELINNCDSFDAKTGKLEYTIQKEKAEKVSINVNNY